MIDDVVYLKYYLWFAKVGVGMMMNWNVFSMWLWDICLKWNDIRFVMKFLYALVWHYDDVMLISHMMVAMKGYSHAIPNELMTMNI